MCQIINQIELIGFTTPQINWCAGCHTYSLCYKNVHFGFSPTDIHEFREVLSRLKPTHYHYYLCNEPQILLKNNSGSSGVFLNKSDVAEIIHLLNQAALMQEVYSILES